MNCYWAKNESRLWSLQRICTVNLLWILSRRLTYAFKHIFLRSDQFFQKIATWERGHRNGILKKTLKCNPIWPCLEFTTSYVWFEKSAGYEFLNKSLRQNLLQARDVACLKVFETSNPRTLDLISDLHHVLGQLTSICVGVSQIQPGYKLISKQL